MSIVNIINVQVLDNPTAFTNPFQFEITFECTAPLTEDLEWKIVYVGSAEDEQYDQTLDCIMVGPVPVGVNKFVYQADAPRAEAIPKGDIIGVTVVLITCAYRGQEFVRVGYYVNNEYPPLAGTAALEEEDGNAMDCEDDDESNKEEEGEEGEDGEDEGDEDEKVSDDEEDTVASPSKPSLAKIPENIDLNLVQRTILADKPRVTRFPIRWDTLDELEQPDVVEEGVEEEVAFLNANNPGIGGMAASMISGFDEKAAAQMFDQRFRS